MKNYIFIITTIFIMGCATTPSVGSSTWYKERKYELNRAYNHGEISKEKYFELRNELDHIRVEYQKIYRGGYGYYGGYYRKGYHHGYGHHHSRHYH